MDKKILMGINVVGIGLALIYLLLGTLSLFDGFTWFAADMIAVTTWGGGNLTGLGVVIGSLIIAVGWFFLSGARSAVLLLKRNLKARKSLIKVLSIASVLMLLYRGYWLFPASWNKWGVIFFVLFNFASLAFLLHPRVNEQFTGTEGLTSKEKRIFTLFIVVILALGMFYAVQMNIGSNKKLAAGEEHRAKIRERYQREDEKILKEFASKEIVSVRFSFDFADDRGAEREAASAGKERRAALNIQFVRDHIIDPIGKNDMPSYQMEDNTLNYAAEFTRAGYERLRKNKYARWISLR